MRRAGIRDVRTLVDVVGDAFTRKRGGSADHRDVRNRAVVTWLGELAAVIAREAYVNDDGDVVVHVGRRGWLWSALTPLIIIALMAIVPLVVGAITWAAFSRVPALAVSSVLLIAIYGAVVWSALTARRQDKRRDPEGPPIRETGKRKGLPRSYWLVSGLATRDESKSKAFPLVRSWLPTAVPTGDTVAAAAGSEELRKLYRALGFKPLPRTAWVLSGRLGCCRKRTFRHSRLTTRTSARKCVGCRWWFAAIVAAIGVASTGISHARKHRARAYAEGAERAGRLLALMRDIDLGGSDPTLDVVSPPV
ncbi:hypothetical protein DEJ34_01180 [Curtobacterium sp. MCPF17_050]|uniref:hypothetical protein n=1 Tax=Curtobacterium sp. MCPF17_050 TaxID=2175664 RepID=UPI0011B59171|nr:hypothetical protein [Curtobacterium sp. MCPF17_050]WIB15771.1 hypothetical protein DEJ34_01180 [Curtobacterium sp. MCPF17_050]